LPLNLAESMEQARQIADGFTQKAKADDDIADVRVLFH